MTNPSTANVIRAQKGSFKSSGKAALLLESPYLPAFAERAKALGGSWQPKARNWAFDGRDTDAVAALCRELYGCDWIAPVATVTVVVEFGADTALDESWVAFGRVILRRRGRDSRVELGAGVTIRSGQFRGVGGSMKYPAIGPADGVIIQIRDVPESLVDPEIERINRWRSDHPHTCTVLDEPPVSPPAGALHPEDDPDIRSIIETFDRLPATQQAQVLARLNGSLPSH